MWFRFERVSEFTQRVTNSSAACVAKNPTPIFRRSQTGKGQAIERALRSKTSLALLPTVLVRISAVEGTSKLSLLVLTQPLRTARKIAFVPLPNCQPVRRTIEKSGLPAQAKEAQNRSLRLGSAPSKDSSCYDLSPLI